MAVFPPNSIN